VQTPRTDLKLRMFFMTACLLFAAALCADAPTLVERAIENMEKTDIDDWSYTVTTSRSGRKTIERHDASKPEGVRWQLLLKNGETPTADELSEYLGAKRDQAERRKRRGREERENEISGMVDTSSLELLAEDELRATYSFRMKVDDEDDRQFADQVQGTLVVDKTLPHVERLEMRSTGEIKPVTGVKISEFHVLMRFDHDAATGSILPLTIETTIKGRAFLVKTLDEDIAVSFTDYRRP
jgi:hypothetical protein